MIASIQAASVFWSESMAVLGDSLHTLIHSLGYAIAITAENAVARLDPSERSLAEERVRSRYGLLVAFLVILPGVLFIYYETWNKLWNPTPVVAFPMLFGASIGLAGNSVAYWILSQSIETHQTHRFAMLDLFSDLGQSVVIILVTPFVYFYRVYVIDAILSSVIASVMLGTTIYILLTKTFKSI